MARKIGKKRAAAAAQLLTHARDLLVKGRWVKGAYYNYKTLPSGKESVGYCAVGALRAAHNGDGDVSIGRGPEFVAAIELLDATCATHTGFGGGGIVNFNDRTSTRKGDVLAKYDEAIKRAGELAQ